MIAQEEILYFLQSSNTRFTERFNEIEQVAGLMTGMNKSPGPITNMNVLKWDKLDTEAVLTQEM